MYRQYEDPYKLETELKKAKERLEGLGDKANVEDYLEVASLEERVNFAWQDDEAEMEGRA